MKAKKVINSVLRHVFLVILCAIWLVPIVWIDQGINVRKFVPNEFTLANYQKLLFGADSVAMFPTWFKNTLIVAIFTCIISSCFVLMVAYAMSCMKFKSRKLKN